MDTEIIVNNVVKEILKECDKTHIIMESKFCRFYVELLMLDPNWGISEDVMNIRSDLQKFIKFVVANLKNPLLLGRVALRIQFFMEFNFEVMEYVTKEHRMERDAMLYALRITILEPNFYDKFHVSGLVEKIVFYITLASGLGDPYDKLVYREVETVFRSVCNEVELKEFMNSLYTVREETLNNLVKVVSGIRLYNKDCKRGGRGIQNVPKLLFRAISAVKNHFMSVVSITKKNCILLSNIIQSCYSVNNSGYKITLDVNIPKWATIDDLEYCKGALLVYQQYSEAIGQLIAEVEKIKKAALIIRQNKEDILEFLHRKVISNMHVRASIIFPVFQSLFNEWAQFQDNTVRLMGLKLFYEDLRESISVVNLDNNLIKNYCEDSSCDPIKMHSHLPRELLRPVRSGCRVFRKETISCWSRQRYEYSGLCPWYMVLTKGAIIKGSEEYGIVKYKKYFYIFSSYVAVQCFMRDPEYYINHILDLARKKCELILFLRLKKQLIDVQHTKKLVDDEDIYIETQDNGTNTEWNMQLPTSTSHYESNVWILRKRACQMAYLSTCKTSSTQTERSFNKNWFASQTYRPKESGTQTMVDNYSGTPTPISFFYGLRGRTDAQQLLLDLTYGEFK